MTETPRETITVAEVARRLGISRTTIYAAIDADPASIPGAAKIGRRVIIRRAPFEAWLAGTTGTQPENVTPLVWRRVS